MKPGKEITAVCFSCQNEFRVILVASLSGKDSKVVNCPFCKSNQVTFTQTDSIKDARHSALTEAVKLAMEINDGNEWPIARALINLRDNHP